MHKSLLLLGLLLSQPMTGYEIHRILRQHGDLYADLKKANLYYLLDHLAELGFLDVQVEPGARGPRKERLIYSVTERGRARFNQLLQEVLRTYEPVASTIGPGVVFLPHLPSEEAIRLLEERRRSIAQRQEEVAGLKSHTGRDIWVGLAMDHLLLLLDADLTWTDRAIERLRQEVVSGSQQPQPAHAPPGGTIRTDSHHGASA